MNWNLNKTLYQEYIAIFRMYLNIYIFFPYLLKYISI